MREESVEEAYTNLIAHCNARIISHAFDYVFTIDTAFPYINPPDEKWWDDQFMARAAEYRRKCEAERPKEEVVGLNVEDGPPMPRVTKMPRMQAKEFNDDPGFTSPPGIPGGR